MSLHFFESNNLPHPNPKKQNKKNKKTKNKNKNFPVSSTKTRNKQQSLYPHLFIPFPPSSFLKALFPKR